MKRIVIAGCGDIALRTASLLRPHFRLYGLARHTQRHPDLRRAGILPLPGDLDHRASLQRIAKLADIVLHFAPPAPDSQGNDLRTRNLLAVLARSQRPIHMIYISTSGVYGDCQGALIDETFRPMPQSSRGMLRLSAEQQIRRWAQHGQRRAAILRVPGIYANDRLPLERLRAGAPAIIQNEDSYSNHIHAHDLARIVLAALRRAKPNRIYHACDEDEMKMGDYFDVIADAHNLARPPRLPRAEVAQRVSPMMWSFMNESRRLDNTRMKRELNVDLHFPTVKHALFQRA